MLVSGIHQSESAILISPLCFGVASYLGHHRASSRIFLSYMVTEFISSFWYKYIFLKICCFTSYLMVSHKSRKVVNNFWTIIFFPKEYHFISFHLRTVKPWIWEPEKLKKYPKEKYANSLCFSGSWTFQTCYQWPSSVSFGDDLVMGAYQRSMSTFWMEHFLWRCLPRDKWDPKSSDWLAFPLGTVQS